MPIEEVEGGFKWHKGKTVHKSRSDALYEARGHYIQNPRGSPPKRPPKKKIRNPGLRSTLKTFG